MIKFNRIARIMAIMHGTWPSSVSRLCSDTKFPRIATLNVWAKFSFHCFPTLQAFNQAVVSCDRISCNWCYIGRVLAKFRPIMGNFFRVTIFLILKKPSGVKNCPLSENAIFRLLSWREVHENSVFCFKMSVWPLYTCLYRLISTYMG